MGGEGREREGGGGGEREGGMTEEDAVVVAKRELERELGGEEGRRGERGVVVLGEMMSVSGDRDIYDMEEVFFFFFFFFL